MLAPRTQKHRNLTPSPADTRVTGMSKHGTPPPPNHGGRIHFASVIPEAARDRLYLVESE